MEGSVNPNTIRRENYVRMLPEAKEYDTIKLTLGNEYINFYSNDESIKDYLLTKKSYLLNTDSTNCIGTICAILEYNLFNTTEIQDEVLIHKSDERYFPGAENVVLFDCENRLLINHYPFHGIINSYKTNNYHSVISSSKESLVQLTRMAFKMALVNYLKNLGYYSLHTAAVVKNNNIYLILGGARTSKTTIFMNLVLNGYEAINDDLIFLRKISSGVEIKYIKMLPSVREGSLRYIHGINKINLKESKRGFSDEYFIDVWDIFDSKDQQSSTLLGKNIKAVILPEYGYNKMKICNADDEYFKKKLVKSLSGFQKIEISNNLLDIMNLLLNKPIYKLELSENMNEFENNFSKFFNEI